MKTRFLLILFLAIVLISCEDENNTIEMGIVETGCANAWDNFNSDSGDNFERIKNYLISENIAVKNVSAYTYYDGSVCLACTCSTGRYIIIEIDEADVAKAEKLGFSLFDVDE